MILVHQHIIWNRRKDFISYHVLSPQERKSDQVLGVSGETVAPQGIGAVRLRIEDDLNDIHTIFPSPSSGPAKMANKPINMFP